MKFILKFYIDYNQIQSMGGKYEPNLVIETW